MCGSGPSKIATLSRPGFENSRKHSEFNAHVDLSPLVANPPARGNHRRPVMKRARIPAWWWALPSI
jgi:hypothetical protein